MIKFLIPMLLISNLAFAGISVCRNDQTNEVVSFSLRGNAINGCHYFSIPGVNPQDYDDLSSLLKTTPRQHLKMTGTTILSVQEITSQEKTAVDDAMAAAQTLSIRNDAKNQMEGFEGSTLYQRAFADILKDEINILRAQHGLAPRTLTQLKNAIKNRVDDGSVDT